MIFYLNTNFCPKKNFKRGHFHIQLSKLLGKRSSFLVLISREPNACSIFVQSAKKPLVKTMLRNVVQKMQDLARRGDSNAGGRPRPNGTTVNGHTNEVKSPTMAMITNFVFRDVHRRKYTRKFRDRMESQRMELL